MIFKKSRIPKKTKFKQKSMKNRMFFGTSILKAFWLDFGRVLGEVWETKILDFRIFFAHERPKAQQEAQNAPKKRPKARNSANMVPLGIQHGVRRIGSVGRLASPKELKTGIFNLYIKT